MGGPLRVEEAGAERSLAVGGFSGRVHVEWDAEAAVTPLGQLAFFVAFVKQGGLFDALVADCPLELTRPNAPAKRDVVGTLVLSILAGHRRHAHITCLRSDGVSPDLLGMRHWRQAAKQDDGEAQYRLGTLYRDGKGVLADASSAAGWFERAAGNGHLAARHAVAMAYLLGRGRSADPAKAIGQLKATAEAGHGASHLVLAHMHLRGIGLPKDEQLALARFRRAAAAGEPKAYFEVGVAYAQGALGVADLGEAYLWYEWAAAAGDPDGLERKGNALVRGEGVEADPEAGVALLVEAVAKGHKRAMVGLGIAFIDGIGGLEKAPLLGLAWYQRAAELGYGPAARTLAAWYAEGTRVVADPGEAKLWLEVAARAGDGEAAHMMGELYDNKTAATLDDKARAVEWYWRGARLGNGKAMRGLANLLRSGTGVQQNRTDAYYWYIRAVAAGAPAQFDVKQMKAEMSAAEHLAAERNLDKDRRRGLFR